MGVFDSIGNIFDRATDALGGWNENYRNVWKQSRTNSANANINTINETTASLIQPRAYWSALWDQWKTDARGTWNLEKAFFPDFAERGVGQAKDAVVGYGKNLVHEYADLGRSIGNAAEAVYHGDGVKDAMKKLGRDYLNAQLAWVPDPAEDLVRRMGETEIAGHKVGDTVTDAAKGLRDKVTDVINSDTVQDAAHGVGNKAKKVLDKLF